MEAAFCVETLEDALARHGGPEIFNTDQGALFTGTAFTDLLASHDIAICMDGKGAWPAILNANESHSRGCAWGVVSPEYHRLW